MAGELHSSKVLIIEEEPRVRTFPAVPTSVAGAVGLTERGPVGQPLLCTTFDEYQAQFGGFTPDSELALAAMGFFENGGSQLWVVRTTHYLDVTAPSSVTATRAVGLVDSTGGPTPAALVGTASAPFRLRDGDLIRLSISGGQDADAVFRGAAAAFAAGGAGPYALEAGMTLQVRIDDGPEQSISFAAADFADIGAATAAEVAAAINAQLAGGRATQQGQICRLASDTEGTSSRLQVVGGTANAVLAFPASAAAGSGNVSNLREVTAAEVVRALEVSVAGIRAERTAGGIMVRTTAVGPGATVQARAATAAAFGFDTVLHAGSASGPTASVRFEALDVGSYGNRLAVEVRIASSGAEDAFDVLVLEDGVYREQFANLRMRPGDPRHLEAAVNHARTGSRYVRATDLRLPDAPVPRRQTVALAGGADGLADLGDADFIGSDAGKTGLFALDQVQDLALLLVPGRATPAVHLAMLAYCEVHRGGTVFAVLDPPADQRATEMVTYVTTTAGLEELSEYGAIYWPRIRVLNPSKSVYGSVEQLVVPPSGVICGVYARTDASRPGGVYEPPAGIETGRMFGVLGFETAEVLEERKRDLVYPHRINPLTTGPGLPRYIDGTRTLKASGNFPYVAERRGVMFLERSIKQGLEVARHRNNNETLRAMVRRSITSFLLTQMNLGAFRSREPAKAFFVDVSEALNPPSVVFAGRLVARIGLATNKPAEFIILYFSQDTRAIEQEAAAAEG
ncbi:MAG: phage tail protein [Myxococcales bacterium]|nr:phage tail protein [Myxococcales bacterium]